MTRLKKHTALIVSEDDSTRSLLAIALFGKFYPILKARSKDQALNLLRNFKISFVLFDEGCDIGSHIEFIKGVKRVYENEEKKIFLAILTSDSKSNQVGCGPTILRKPFSLDELFQAFEPSVA